MIGFIRKYIQLKSIGLLTKSVGRELQRYPRAKEILIHTRAQRLEAEQKTTNERGLGYHTVKTLIEMIPGGLGPYGIGDMLSLFEGLHGQEIAGRKLDTIDRIISILAALIPLVPATPFREAIRNIRKTIEDTATT